MQPILIRLQRFRPAALHRLNRGIGPSLRNMYPQPSPSLRGLYITGFTLTGAGAALAGCTVELYRARDDVRTHTFNSDGSGIFTSSPVSPGELYYAVAYKAGAPDVAGTTQNILAGDSSVNIYLRDPTAADSAGVGSGVSRSRVANA